MRRARSIAIELMDYSASIGMYRGRHNITVGGDLRKEQFNELFQQDPRGSFGFTGAGDGIGYR